MRRNSVYGVTALFFGLACGQAIAAPDINGIWSREDGNARIWIAACDDRLCATNIWVKPGGSDERIGDLLEMTVKPTSGGGLTGEAFDQRHNLRYSMDITVNGSEMTSRRCVVGGQTCQSVKWSRAS
jgi:uncharacterized protein (DUF2147 family)